MTNRLPSTQLLIIALSAIGLLRPAICAEPAVTNEAVTTAVAVTEGVAAHTASIRADARPAQPGVLPKEHHVWARFPVGAWREIEVTTETFDENGKLFGQSVTTQKETLKAVADDSYVLDVQATVDVSGKRIAGPWNTRVLRLSTDRSGTVFSSTRRADELLTLHVDTANCQVWEVQYAEESRNLQDRLYYSPEVFPHILRRDVLDYAESSAIVPPVLDTTLVTARSIPFAWEGRIFDCVEQQTVRRREKGNSQIIALLSQEVPGGEVQSRSTDFDSAGRRVRWSVQKLVAFGVTTPDNLAEGPTISRISGGQEHK